MKWSNSFSPWDGDCGGYNRSQCVWKREEFQVTKPDYASSFMYFYRHDKVQTFLIFVFRDNISKSLSGKILFEKYGLYTKLLYYKFITPLSSWCNNVSLIK